MCPQLPTAGLTQAECYLWKPLTPFCLCANAYARFVKSCFGSGVNAHLQERLTETQVAKGKEDLEAVAFFGITKTDEIAAPGCTKFDAVVAVCDP